MRNLEWNPETRKVEITEFACACNSLDCKECTARVLRAVVASEKANPPPPPVPTIAQIQARTDSTLALLGRKLDALGEIASSHAPPDASNAAAVAALAAKLDALTSAIVARAKQDDAAPAAPSATVADPTTK